LNRCKFKEFGKDRSYFDFTNMHDMPRYKLKIAAGYKASMDVYGNKLLLCTELAHKLINGDTVLDVIEKLCKDVDPESYKQKCYNYLVGQTVMTNYNNKTYKIDDISWEQKPSDTFDKKNGERISFVDYYKKQYDIRIKNERQPLLVSMPKLKDKERGQAHPILLIPELCALTGFIQMKTK
jgi:aubergine